MPLAVGSTLAHYRLLAPLGSGAMGEVYRASDSRLGREVAIKVLPEHFAADEERLRRFEREAKSIASLNHPNVAQIYGVDQVGQICFLVLELVPGETLEERIRRGPLPIDEALDVCRQIAEGLEAAHEAGVIHRDLKPANVRITPEGRVKLLDFGLAKPVSEARDGASASDSVLSTEAGRLLGTPTYMAPEQARGKPIDKRVDVWAFGCVFYECLTARRAFAGESLTDVLGAVLHSQPDLDALPPGLSPRIRQLVASCLEKDPRERLRDLGDARRELAREDDALAAIPAVSRRRSGGLVVFGLLALAAATGTYFAGRASRPAASRPIVQLELLIAPATSLGRSSAGRPYHPSFAITSDGRRVVFVGNENPEPALLPAVADAAAPASSSAPRPSSRLYVRALDAAEAVVLAGTEGAETVFLSPDDRWAGFLADGEIRKAPLDGGPVERIARLADGGMVSLSPLVSVEHDFFGACFDSDGSVVFGRFRDGLWEVPAGASVPRRLTQVEEADSHRLPRPLPGGRGLLLTQHNHGHPRVCVVPRSGGAPRILLEEASDARFVAPDRLLFARDGTLMSAPFDLERLEVGGAPTVVAANLLHSYDGVAPGAAVLTAFFDVSSTGTLVFAEGGRIPVAPSRLVWVARDGTAERLAGSPDGYYARPRLSPDGRRVVVSYAPSGARALDCRTTLLDLERGTRARIEDEEGYWGPTWSSDGKRVYVGKRGHGIAVLEADGSAPSRELPGTPIGFASSASPDGAWLFQTTSETATGSDILRVDVVRDAPPEPLIHSRANEAWPEISPEGTLLAYGSDVSGRTEVYLQSYPGPGPRVQVSIEGGNSPLWSRRGDELFFMRMRSDGTSRRELWVAEVVRQPVLSVGTPQLLFAGLYTSLGGLTNFDVSTDGQRFLMIERDHATELPVRSLRVVLDWLPGMRPLPGGGRRP